MANEKALFNTLNDGTGAGLAPRAKAVGDAPSTDLGHLAFGFRDSAGNVVLPQLTSLGKLPVDTEASAGVIKHSRVANDTGSLAYTDLSTLSGVTTGKIYTNWTIKVCSQNEAEFELVRIDDSGGTPVESIIATFMTGPGQPSDGLKSGNEFEISTVGGTGTQVIKIRGKNLHKVSRLVATMSAVEVTF